MHSPTITLNGAPVKLDQEFNNAHELVHAAMTAAANAEEVIANVVIDGRVMEDFDNSLTLLALDNVVTVSIQTEHPDDAAAAGIENFAPLASFITRRLTEASKEFRLGKPQEAFAKFMMAIDMLQDGLRFLDLYLGYRAVGEEDQNRLRFVEIHDSLKPVLEEFEAAQGVEDWLHMADIIEHEFIPLVVELGMVGSALHQEAQGNAYDTH